MSGTLARSLERNRPRNSRVGDRVDMGQPDQIAHDRSDTGSAAATGRKQPAAGAATAYAHRHRSSHLEDVAVKQEEPRQAVVGDQAQLLLESRAGFVRPCRCRRSGGRARPGRAAPALPERVRRCRRSRDSGSPDRGSGRSGSGRPPRSRRGRRRLKTAGRRPPGARSTDSWFPRRSASHASSVELHRIATSASWRKRSARRMGMHVTGADQAYSQCGRPARSAAGCGGRHRASRAG